LLWVSIASADGGFFAADGLSARQLKTCKRILMKFLGADLVMIQIAGVFWVNG